MCVCVSKECGHGEGAGAHATLLTDTRRRVVSLAENAGRKNFRLLLIGKYNMLSFLHSRTDRGGGIPRGRGFFYINRELNQELM